MIFRRSILQWGKHVHSLPGQLGRVPREGGWDGLQRRAWSSVNLLPMKSLALVSAVAVAPCTSSVLKPTPTQSRPEAKTLREYNVLDQVCRVAQPLLLKHGEEAAGGPSVPPKEASGNKGGFCQLWATGKELRGTSELSDAWQAASPL